MSTSTINMEERKPLIDQVIFERRVLLGCTGLIGIGIILWITAVSTDYWYVVEGGHGLYVPQKGRYFVSSRTGLWKVCRSVLVPNPEFRSTMMGRTTSTTTAKPDASNKTELPSHLAIAPGKVNATAKAQNATEHVKTNITPPLVLNETMAAKMTPLRWCAYVEMFPTEQKIKNNPALDPEYLHYSRTEVSFAIISMFVMCMGFGFSLYTFMNPRYMFKRLAGGIHFISAATGLVVVQVLISSIDYGKQYLPYSFPKGSTYYFSFSFFLAWAVLLVNAVSGFIFMLYSRKRKGNKAITEELGLADEPTIMGR